MQRDLFWYIMGTQECVCVCERERERERLDSFLLSIESDARELRLWRYSDVWHDPYMCHDAFMCMYVCSICICIWRCRCIYLGLCIWIYIFRAIPKILQGIWSFYLERPKLLSVPRYRVGLILSIRWGTVHKTRCLMRCNGYNGK